MFCTRRRVIGEWLLHVDNYQLSSLTPLLEVGGARLGQSPVPLIRVLKRVH